MGTTAGIGVASRISNTPLSTSSSEFEVGSAPALFAGGGGIAMVFSDAPSAAGESAVSMSETLTSVLPSPAEWLAVSSSFAPVMICS
jgi:hypothetical protein